MSLRSFAFIPIPCAARYIPISSVISIVLVIFAQVMKTLSKPLDLVVAAISIHSWSISFSSIICAARLFTNAAVFIPTVFIPVSL